MGGFMRRVITILVLILVVGSLSAASVPLPVPQAVQGAYAVSDMKQRHYDDAGKQHIVIDSGTLYAMNNTDLRADLYVKVIENVVDNGVVIPRHVSFFSGYKGSEVMLGSLYYLNEITVEKNGLVFNFHSFNLYRFRNYNAFTNTNDTGILSRALKIRFAMTPAQIDALTPEAVHKMTEPFFTVSPVSVHSFTKRPEDVD
jgi:hypothetical protein